MSEVASSALSSDLRMSKEKQIKRDIRNKQFSRMVSETRKGLFFQRKNNSLKRGR